MIRSVYKGPYVPHCLLKKVKDHIASKSKKPIKTTKRSSDIIADFVGLVFAVHNGKTYIPVTITKDMIGDKLGSYSATRKPTNHPKVKVIQQKKKKKTR